jgi:hypothetical protein
LTASRCSVMFDPCSTFAFGRRRVAAGSKFQKGNSGGGEALFSQWRTRMPHVENNQIVETATEARGAKPGRPVLYVLLASMAGVIVLFTVVYFVLFATH